MVKVFSHLYAQMRTNQKVVCHFCTSIFDWTIEPRKYGHIREPGPYNDPDVASISQAACGRCYQVHCALGELEW